MKLRPQVQLRFRDEGQYERLKGLARESGLSLNEWLLRKVEGLAGENFGSSADTGRASERGGQTGEAESGNSEGAGNVPGQPSRGALGKSGQRARNVQGKSEGVSSKERDTDEVVEGRLAVAAGVPVADDHKGHRIVKAGDQQYCMNCKVFF